MTALALALCKSQPNLRRPQLLAEEEGKELEDEPRSHTVARSVGRSPLPTSVKASKKDQTNSGGWRYGSRRGNGETIESLAASLSGLWSLFRIVGASFQVGT